MFCMCLCFDGISDFQLSTEACLGIHALQHGWEHAVHLTHFVTRSLEGIELFQKVLDLLVGLFYK